MEFYGRSRAPGKVILLGEHAVVYGYPAISLAIDRFTQVTLASSSTPVVRTRIPHVPQLFPEAALHEACRVVLDRVARHLGLELGSSALEVESEVPPGVGLGSSAALSVATVRAVGAAVGRSLSDEEVCEAAFHVEHYFHGRPSGIDNTVATFGGLLRFVRGEPPLQLRCPAAPPLVVIVGRQPRQTGAVVARLEEKRRQAPGSVDARLRRIGELASEAEPLLARADWQALGEVMLANHALLRELEVSTPELDELVAGALCRGAYGAKLTGGGGGGAVLCLVPEARHEFTDWFQHQGWHAFSVDIFCNERGNDERHSAGYPHLSQA